MDTGAAGHDGPGFIRSLMDAPCPHEVSSWGDYVENSFTPSLMFQPCPTKTGKRIETINNQSGIKKYREVFDVQSFSQLSSSVASSSMSCALDCRKVDGCTSFKWTPEDNSCSLGGLTDSASGDGDSDPVYIETLGNKINIYSVTSC